MPSAMEKSAEWDRLAPYLDRALDLDRAERESWLGELSVSQPEIALSVRKLLNECDELNATGFLNSSPLESESKHLISSIADILKKSSGSNSIDWLRNLPGYPWHHSSDRHQLDGVSAGAVFGAYRLIREIGQGGMSTVWLAERCDGQLKREVALKLPYAGPQRSRIVERFQRERDILATLTHPNIARIYDAGVGELGQPYLAIEYVEGATLTHYCDTKRLALRDRLQVFLQVLAAVQFAHAHLVIHRDLKPSNILVTPAGRVVLLDFGIAKILDDDSSRESQLTQMAGRPLTPDYASPEQIAAQPLGTASDVYSLGVLLYELLVGERPYRLKRDSRGALEEAILSSIPQRPSNVAISAAHAAARDSTPRKLSASLAGDLDTIVLKALKKDPEDRYVSVEALSQDIQNYLRNIPVSARPDSGWYRFSRFIARHKLTAAATTIALLAIGGGGAAALWQASNAASERDRAWELASQDEAINDFTETLITQAAISKRPVTISEILARSEKLALADSHGNPEVQAAILGIIARRYYTIGDPGKAAQLFERALSVIGDSRSNRLRSKLICEHAYAISLDRRYDEALIAIDNELAKLQSDPENASSCLSMRAQIACAYGDAEGALRFATLALDRFHQRKNRRLPNEGSFLAVAGFANYLNGKNEQANRYFELALKNFIDSGREQGAEVMTVRNNWASVSLSSGVPKHALELYDRTLKELAEVDAAIRPPSALIYNRANALEAIGRYAEAQEGYRLTVELSSEQKTLQGQALGVIGEASIAERFGDIDRAKKLLEQAKQIASKLPPGSNVPLKKAVVEGRVAADTGHFAEALERFEQTTRTVKSTSTKLEGGLGKAEANLRSGNAAAAVESARATLQTAASMQGGVPHSSYAGLAWLMLGRALQTQGDTVGAHSAFEAAVAHLSTTVDGDNPDLVRAERFLRDAG